MIQLTRARNAYVPPTDADAIGEDRPGLLAEKRQAQRVASWAAAQQRAGVVVSIQVRDCDYARGISCFLDGNQQQ